MKVFILTLLPLLISSMIVPDNPEGYLYKKSPKKVIRIDVYKDPLWLKSRAMDPPFRRFLNNYKVNGDNVTDYVEVYTHFFPLPYHHNAFFLSQLAPFIYDKTGCGELVNN